MSLVEVLTIVIFLQFIPTIHSYEYCTGKRQSELCRHKKKHIICHPEQIVPMGPLIKEYPNTKRLKEWYTYWHNYYRNQVACGKSLGSEGYLPQATRMRELSWDDELEYVARRHARRCRMQHDECRNTFRIRYSGQNLAFHSTEAGPEKAYYRGQRAVYKWHKEVQNVTAEVVRRYHHIADVKIGHFTVLVNDQVARLGCVQTYCQQPGVRLGREVINHLNFMTCNYDYTNIPGVAVYATGKAASACKNEYNVGRSSNFSCLCENFF